MLIALMPLSVFHLSSPLLHLVGEGGGGETGDFQVIYSLINNKISVRYVE